ncbi:MAG: hypothetical protein R3E67_04815 [Pseudomonadales bacterium]
MSLIKSFMELSCAHYERYFSMRLCSGFGDKKMSSVDITPITDFLQCRTLQAWIERVTRA